MIKHILICLSIILTIAACTSRQRPVTAIPPAFFNPYFPQEEVLIEPGDILTVRFFYNPEMNQTATVRQDGKISLPFFQGLDIAGLTPEQLHDKLVHLYSKEFVDPVISVDFEQKAQQFVYVTGEVNSGGAKPLSSNLTVGMILAESQVKERSAAMNSVILVRRESDTDYMAYRIDARLRSGDERDLYLAPEDILIVPRNKITRLGDFVQQYIRDVVPPDMNIGYAYSYGRYRTKGKTKTYGSEPFVPVQP